MVYYIDLIFLIKNKSLRVPLEPFVHQVGGHFPMACLAKQTVCKPLNEREHLFYKTLPKILTPYVPRYEGMFFDEFFFKN